MKRLFALINAAAIVFCLSGCSITMLREVYESETGETLPIKEGTLVTEYTYFIQYTETKYADGTSTKIHYEYRDIKDPRNPSHITQENSQCIYYENGEIIGTETYIRDEYGNILTSTPDWEGGETQTFEYTYDENDHILTETAYTNGALNYEAVYTYDEQGNRTCAEYRGDSVERFEYAYDNQSRLIEETRYLDGSRMNRTITEYDESGNRQKVTFFDGTGNLTGYEEYTFDQKSSKETVREYSSSGTLQRYFVNSYNIDNKMIYQEVFSPEDKLISATNWYMVRSSYTYMDYD